MKTDNPEPLSSASAGATPDSAKLVSLLALAAGAVAMPQSSIADIIFTDLSSSPAQVGFGTGFGSTYVLNNLPGLARLGFRTHTVKTIVTSSRTVLASQPAGYVRLKTQGFFVVAAAQGQTWNQIAGGQPSHGTVGYANFYTHHPGGFSHQYLAFKFQDSTQGNAVRYGWVELSLSNPSAAGNPDVTIFGYAYDNSGAFIAMGNSQVPEPGAVALMALGALTLGAKGLRSWRRNRPPGRS